MVTSEGEMKNRLYDHDIREPLFRFLEATYGKVRILEEKNTGDAMTEYSDNETVFIPVRVVEWETSVITVNGFRITVTEDTDVPALRTVLKAIGDISWN